MSTYGYDPVGSALGGLFGLLIVVALLGYVLLLATSNAVLIHEIRAEPTSVYYNYRCRYFTGTQVIDQYIYSSTGCPRMIPVGAR